MPEALARSRPLPGRAPHRLIAGILLGAFALIPLALIAHQIAGTGQTFSGADGPFPADQYQYLQWIRQFGRSLLAANNLDVAPRHEVFFHPMFFLSGMAYRAGASIQLSYLLWTPVAVAALLLGAARYVERLVGTGVEALLALLLALFLGSPVAPFSAWLHLGSGAFREQVGSLAGEILPAGELWGYLPTAIAVGVTALFVLGAEDIATVGAGESRPARVRKLAAVSAFGFIASWLHPWQGETLVLTSALLIACAPRSRALWRLAGPVAVTLLPLVYYALLSKYDPAWSVASQSNSAMPRYSAAALAAGLLPLLVVAAPGLRSGRWDVRERLLVLWPFSALVTYLVLDPPFAQHAFEGISIPLAVLTTRASARLPRYRLATLAAATALLTVPGLVNDVSTIHDAIRLNSQNYYLQPGERQALAYLDRVRTPGAVLPATAIGPAVPVWTDRQTWLGHPSWTRDYAARAQRSDSLFSATISPARARALLASAGAKFLLDDCRHNADLQPLIRSFVASTRRFGCATVYELRASS